MQCRRTYLITSYHIHTPFDRKAHDRRVRKVMVFSALAMFFAYIGMLPVTALFAVLGFWQCSCLMKYPESAAAPDGLRQYPSGEYLKNRSDYIQALRAMPLAQMPLGIYGERAAQQVERMEKKQQALNVQLGSKHPFSEQTAEADAYILANCKQVIFRLKHCDQSDPQLCRMHAEFLQSVLDENDRILRDYEALLLEIAQMNEDLPLPEPSLDVLADTLHSVRTGTQPAEIPSELD